MSNNNKTAQFNDLLNLIIATGKAKESIQKSILDILSNNDNQKEFLDFANTQIRDKVFTTKIQKFQNNLNQKSTQELHFKIGDDEQLEQKISLKRAPKSTLKQSERPYIFEIKDIEPPKTKTLEEQIQAFKKKMAKEFDVELEVTAK